LGGDLPRALALCLLLTVATCGCASRGPSRGLLHVEPSRVEWHRASALAYAPNGKAEAILLRGSDDPEFRLSQSVVHVAYDAPDHLFRTVLGYTGVTGLAFSPDGKALAFLTYQSWTGQRAPYLVLLDLQKDRLTRARLQADVIFSPHPFWSNDGRLIAVPGYRRGIGAQKGLAQHLVWVGDDRARKVAWHTLPCSKQEQSVCLGWSPAGDALIGLNVVHPGPQAPRKPGLYLWTMKAKGGKYQYRPVSGPAAALPLSFFEWQHIGDYTYLGAGRYARDHSVGMAVLDLRRAVLAPFPNARAYEGRWTASPDGRWVAMMSRTERNTLSVYSREGKTLSFRTPGGEGDVAARAAWGPGANEVTVTTANPSRPIVIVNIVTGERSESVPSPK
jgi:hypothetical protein